MILYKKLKRVCIVIRLYNVHFVNVQCTQSFPFFQHPFRSNRLFFCYSNTFTATRILYSMLLLFSSWFVTDAIAYSVEGIAWYETTATLPAEYTYANDIQQLTSRKCSTNYSHAMPLDISRATTNKATTISSSIGRAEWKCRNRCTFLLFIIMDISSNVARTRCWIDCSFEEIFSNNYWISKEVDEWQRGELKHRFRPYFRSNDETAWI